MNREETADKKETVRRGNENNAEDIRGRGTSDGSGEMPKDSGKKRPGSRFVKPHSLVRIRGGVDRPMLILIFVLLAFGLVMVFSASFASAHKTLDDSFY